MLRDASLFRPRETSTVQSMGAADASRDVRESLVALENHSSILWDHRVEQRKKGEK